MSDYSRLCTSITDAGYSFEGWAKEGEYFDNYSASCIIEDLSSKLTIPAKESIKENDKYMRMSYLCRELIKEIKDMYLHECLNYDSNSSNIRKLESLIDTRHW